MATHEVSDLPSLFEVEGLVAVVTGGATGIGLMIATALENNGAIVYIIGRRQDALDKAVQANSRRGNFIAISADVSDRLAVQRVVSMIKARHGYINLLVNNAGIARNHIARPLPKPDTTDNDITKLQTALWNAGTPDDWADTFELNTTAVYYTTVAFLELLHEGNRRGNRGDIWSQVITITSLSALRKDDGSQSLSYMLSKTAATHLGKAFAHFLKDWKIRSNVICPGLFPSEMTQGVPQSAVEKVVPMQRWGTVDNMGGLVLFLCSKAGAYVDGVMHIVDGGVLSRMPSIY